MTMKTVDAVVSTGHDSWNCASPSRITTSPDETSAVKFLMVPCRSAADFEFNSIQSGHCIAPLLRNVSASRLNKLLVQGGFFSFQTMHPSQSNSGTSDDVHLSRSFTAFDRSVPHRSHHVSLSQPCLPVANLGPTKILPFLFLGSQSDAHCEETMAQNGITYVLNVSVSSPRPTFIQDGHFLRIPVNDGYADKLSPFFNDAFQFLDKVREANGCVLIHCLAGVSRSPTLAIAYIMHLLKMSMDDAYRYVKDKRPTISPNFNFLGQLLEYEKQIVAKQLDIADGHFEASFPEKQSLDNQPNPILRPNDYQHEAKLDFALANASHVLMLTSPTTALARLNFSHLSPLKEQPSPPVDETEASIHPQTSRAGPVVTVRLGSKHCATKRPLSDPAIDGHALEGNGHEGVNIKRPLMRPSSINFTCAAVSGAKQKAAIPNASRSLTKDCISDSWKTFICPAGIVEQKNSSCLSISSGIECRTSLDDSSTFEDFRSEAKNKAWLPAENKWFSGNNENENRKTTTERSNNGNQASDGTTQRPNKLSLPRSFVTVAKPSHPNTIIPLKSDTIKNSSTYTPQTAASSQACGMATDLNKFIATATARPAELAITLDCRFNCDEVPHSVMARKSRSLEDILNCPSPCETRNSNEQGISPGCNKRSSYRINVLASPVALGLEKHIFRCQTAKSDAFQSPSPSESPEMIPVS